MAMEARLAAKSTTSGRWHVCRRRFRPRQRPASQGACNACIAHLHTARQRLAGSPQNWASLAGAIGPVEKIVKYCCIWCTLALLQQARTKGPDDVGGGGGCCCCVADVTIQLAAMLDLCWWRELRGRLTFYLSALIWCLLQVVLCLCGYRETNTAPLILTYAIIAGKWNTRDFDSHTSEIHAPKDHLEVYKGR